MQNSINNTEEEPKAPATLRQMLSEILAIQKSAYEERIAHPRPKSRKCKRERARKKRR